MRSAKTLLILAFVFSAVFVFVKTITKVTPSPTPAPQVLGEPDTKSDETSIEIGDKNYNYYYVKVNIDKVSLHLNLDDKESSSDAKSKLECSALVSGGFYSEDNEPIGLFISDGEKISGFRENKLLDGILSVNDFSTPRITTEPPQDHLKFGLQTGPILKYNNEVSTLSLVRDSNERRVVAATTGNNELYFIVFYDAKSAFKGPLLKDLPQVLERFEEQNEIILSDAINLDGGSASAFLADGAKLTEISTIGSYFCIK